MMNKTNFVQLFSTIFENVVMQALFHPFLHITNQASSMGRLAVVPNSTPTTWLPGGVRQTRHCVAQAMRKPVTSCATQIALQREKPGVFCLTLHGAWGELYCRFLVTPAGLQIELSGTDVHRLQTVMQRLTPRFRTRFMPLRSHNKNK